MAIFEASCLSRGSLQRGRLGRPIEPDTVAGYASALCALLSRDSGMRVLVPEAAETARAFIRGANRARRSGQQRGSRKKRRGLRARHLRAAVAGGRFDRTRSWWARRRWAAALCGHVLLARGGELGRVRGKAFDASAGLTWADVSWHEAGEAHATHAGCTVHMPNVKVDGAGGPRYPVPIRRHGAPGAPSDPLCACDMLRAAWDEDVRLLGRAEALAAPVFRRTARGGAESALDSSDVLQLVREVASAAGETALEEFGAHSLRIGGASDLCDVFVRRVGIEGAAAAAKPVLKSRGRWRAFNAFIYQRVAMAASMDVAARMMGVDGVEVEAVFSHWAQPAA